MGWLAWEWRENAGSWGGRGCGRIKPFLDESTSTPLKATPRRRFQAVDARCQMGLDEIRPEEWAKLEAATDDYIASAADSLSAASQALLKVGRGRVRNLHAA